MPKVEFREFQEFEIQNDTSQAKIHMRRSDTEVGMVVAYHLCGRYGHIMLLGRESVSRDVVKSKTFCLTFSTFFFCFSCRNDVSCTSFYDGEPLAFPQP